MNILAKLPKYVIIRPEELFVNLFRNTTFEEENR
jgi:hypothetical protein